MILTKSEYNALVSASETTCASLKVYAYLSLFDEKAVVASNSSLACALNLSGVTISTALKTLEDVGLIHISKLGRCYVIVLSNADATYMTEFSDNGMLALNSVTIIENNDNSSREIKTVAYDKKESDGFDLGDEADIDDETDFDDVEEDDGNDVYKTEAADFYEGWEA